MGLLTELQALDVDHTNKIIQIFTRVREEKDILHINLLEADQAYHVTIKKTHKPRVLACSAIEYLNVLKNTFSHAQIKCISGPTFQLKWVRSSSTLTLMEESKEGIGMKYTTIEFQKVSNDNEYWSSFLHDLVQKDMELEAKINKQTDTINSLQSLIKSKDETIELSIQSKQTLEDELFHHYCSLLNEKKNEIQRLQHEVNVATARADAIEQDQNNSNTVKRKRGKQSRPLTKRARIKKEVIENESSHSENEQIQSDSDQDVELQKKCASQPGIDAYSELTSVIRPGTQISSASDIIAHIDNKLIKHEETENNHTTFSASTTPKEDQKNTTESPSLVENLKKEEDSEDILDILG